MRLVRYSVPVAATVLSIVLLIAGAAMASSVSTATAKDTSDNILRIPVGGGG